MANGNVASTSKYVVGDLLWSRIPGYPYWPCMVTYDPSVGIFEKIKSCGRSTVTVYHVQYFGGKAERGWTWPNNILDYRGEEQYQNYVAELRKNLEKLPSGARNKELSKFSVSASRLHSWKTAISEADKVLSSSKNGSHVHICPVSSDDDLKSTTVRESTVAAKLCEVIQTVDCGQDGEKTLSCRETDNRCEKSTAKGNSVAKINRNMRSKNLESSGGIYDDKTSSCKQFNNRYKKSTAKEVAKINGNRQSKKLKASNDIGSEDTSNCREIDNLCIICEKMEADLLCGGSCMQWFHAACLQLVSVPKHFQCAECLREKHSCFSCKSDNGETKKCRKANCGKFYHVACMKKYRVSSRENFICPLHFCHTCFSENPQMMQSSKSKYIQCIRCPVAYHKREFCAGAGAVVLTESFVICPEHAEVKETNSKISNISWCSDCGKNDGKFVNCITCPLAFHEDCVVVTEDDHFHCENCLSRKHLRNGALIWVRIGRFKWWPGKILFQEEVPELLLKKLHGVGDFPVKILKTNMFYWIQKRIAKEYCENDKKFALRLAVVTKNSKLGTFGENYSKCLTESAKEFDKIAEARKLQVKEKSKFQFIRTNRLVGVNKLVDAQLAFECNCDPNSEFPCGYDSMCLNRSMYYECHPSLCPAKEKCCNQKFVKREYPRLTYFETSNRGFGLKTLENLKKGQFVIEYVGDVIDESELCKRISEKSAAKDRNYYFLTLEKDRYIDAGPRGNLSRYMNHSCSPNCETQKWSVNGEMRVGLFAMKDIPAGSEVTFDYNWDSFDYGNFKCYCESQSCCGTIGGKLHNDTDINSANQKLKNNYTTIPGTTIKVKCDNGEIDPKSMKLINIESSPYAQSNKRKSNEILSSAKSVKQLRGDMLSNAENFESKNDESTSTVKNVNFGNGESSTSTESVNLENNESSTTAQNVNFENSEKSANIENSHFKNNVGVIALDGRKVGMKITRSGSSTVVNNYGVLWVMDKERLGKLKNSKGEPGFKVIKLEFGSGDN